MISSELSIVDISEDNCMLDGKDFNLSILFNNNKTKRIRNE